MQNDWNLQKKWGKLKYLLIPLYVGADDLLKMLNLPDVDTLHYDVRYLSRYVDEEYYLRSESDPQASKKKRVEEILTVTSKGHHVSPSKSHILEDILKHQYIGRQWAEKLVKYLQGGYKKKYDGKIKTLRAVEEQLAKCITELATMSPSRAIEEFKKSVAFKMIVQDQIQEARIRLVHRTTGAEIEGLTLSQAFGDTFLDSNDDEVESELQKAFSLEEDNDIEILQFFFIVGGDNIKVNITLLHYERQYNSFLSHPIAPEGAIGRPRTGHASRFDRATDLGLEPRRPPISARIRGVIWTVHFPAVDRTVRFASDVFKWRTVARHVSNTCQNGAAVAQSLPPPIQ
ncbi:hypothetical protein IEQ34_011798 [Dendrobium chrysotoxum]|uniref:Uncharacterized protein n=1 Tax=Dendrobium chrysotoxum TaxID=161865 RepID=A0AAV7GB07_DENCH|nr:hypothetical protein IEQ34_011798 [Dendrobium chrysotoxum]